MRFPVHPNHLKSTIRNRLLEVINLRALPHRLVRMNDTLGNFILGYIPFSHTLARVMGKSNFHTYAYENCEPMSRMSTSVADTTPRKPKKNLKKLLLKSFM